MRRVAPILVLAASCSSVATTTVDVAEESGVMLFVVFDGDRRITRATPTFGVRDGVIAFGERPNLRLEDGEEEIIRVRVDEAALALAVSGYDAARGTEFAVRADAPPDSPRRITHTSLIHGHLERSLLDETVFEALTLGEETLRVINAPDTRVTTALARLTIEVPVDFEHCRNPTGDPLKPFGVRAAILDEIRPIATGSIQSLGRIDADTYVGLTSNFLYVLRRGEQAVDRNYDPNEPAVQIPAGRMFPADRRGRLTSVAVDPGPSNDGGRRVIVTGFYEPSEMPEDHTGYLFELVFANDGLTFVRTATVVAEAQSREVAFDAGGRFAAMFDRGHVFFGERDSDQITEVAIPTVVGPPDIGRRLIHTHRSRRPFLAGTRGRLHFFDQDRGMWDSTILTSALQDSLHFAGIGASTSLSSPMFWAIGSRNPLYQFVDDGWAQFELTMPPRHRVCSPGGDPNQPLFGEPIESMTMGRDYAWMVLEGCTQILEIRLADACVSVREIEGETPRMVDDYLERLVEFDGELFAGGEGGVLLSTRVE